MSRRRRVSFCETDYFVVGGNCGRGGAFLLAATLARNALMSRSVSKAASGLAVAATRAAAKPKNEPIKPTKPATSDIPNNSGVFATYAYENPASETNSKIQRMAKSLTSDVRMLPQSASRCEMSPTRPPPNARPR